MAASIAARQGTSHAIAIRLTIEPAIAVARQDILKLLVCQRKLVILARKQHMRLPIVSAIPVLQSIKGRSWEPQRKVYLLRTV